MPGLVGLAHDAAAPPLRPVVEQMLLSMQHESWYRSGLYETAQPSACFGWTAHPRELSDSNPIVSDRGDLALIFSGEIYQQSRQSPEIDQDAIHAQGGRGDDMLHLYEQHGEEFVRLLNGWFAGAIVDYRRGKVILFNDRYGMHRVFVHQGRGAFYFASEAKALLRVVPQARQFDPVGLGDMLTCGCTLGEASLFRHVQVLPPASVWVLEGGAVKRRITYFNSREWESVVPFPEQECVQRVVDSFSGIVARYAKGSPPVALSLTGGLDSRMVIACLDRNSGAIPCYTFASRYRDTYDVKVARQVAAKCGQPYQVITLGDEFLDRLPVYLRRAVEISDGYLGLSGAAELYANSIARGIAPVRLTANGGGELLRGDRAFKCILPGGAFVTAALRPFLHGAQTRFQELARKHPVTFSLFHQMPLQGYGRLAIERSQVVLRTPFMDNDLVGLVYRAPAQLRRGPRLSLAVIASHRPELLAIPTDRGLLSTDGLGIRLARQLWREALFKAEYWSTHGMPSWVAGLSRFGLQAVLETAFSGRHKFQHFAAWTRQRLGSYLSGMILEESAELWDFFDKPATEKLLHAHLTGQGNYLHELDRLITLSLAAKSLFDVGCDVNFDHEESVP
jgi:asparagine synthase (glutamine-hydrolysing)